MAEVFVLIPGNPFGKQSVRAGLRGKRVITYMPKETIEYENRCAVEARMSMAGKDMILGPVGMRIELHYPIPASWSHRKRSQAVSGNLRPTVKPDSSNVLKSVEDGFTGIVWKDDAQVVEHTISKVYSETPCVIVTITELDTGLGLKR